MVGINSSDLKKAIIDAVKVNLNTDVVPTELSNVVVPTIETNPKLVKCINITYTANASNATSATLLTTPSDRVFNICACALSVIKDAGSTSVNSRLEFTPEGENIANNLLTIAGISGVAQNDTQQLAFPIPIRVAKGTTINVTNSTANANVKSSGVVLGYYTDE